MTVHSNVIIRSLYKYIPFGRIGERLVFFLPHPLGPPAFAGAASRRQASPSKERGKTKERGALPPLRKLLPVGDKSPLIPSFDRLRTGSYEGGKD